MYMSMNKTNSLFKTQKENKPKIETLIPEWLDGDMKMNALEFTAWLRANKMSPTWASANSWKASYKGKRICYVKLLYIDREGDKNKKYSWVISVYYTNRDKYNEVVKNEGLQSHIRDNPWYCNCTIGGLPQNCGSRMDVTILGTEIKGVCGGYYHMYFCDPNAKAIDGIKKLIEFERNDRKNLIF